MTMATTSSSIIDVVTVNLQSLYNIHAHVQLVVDGVNTTLSATDSAGRVYFVRIYREKGRSARDIDSELSTLQAITQSDLLAAAKPIASLNNSYRTTISLDRGVCRFLAVFDQAQGAVIEHASLDEASMQAIGRSLKDLHSRAVLADSARSRRLLPETFIQDTVRKLSSHSEVGDKLSRRVNSALACIIPASQRDLPLGFCHGDVRLSNLRLSGQRVTFFDFDDCGIGPQWLDLVTMGWWLEVSDPQSAAKMWRSLLQGYGVPISELRSVLGWLVSIQQLRSLRFLVDYIVMEGDLWSEVFSEAADLIERATTDRLAIQIAH